MEKGVWRTIGGRRVFIKDGEDLATAMKKSGKFDFKNKKGLTKEGKEKLKELEKDEEHKKSFNELLEQTAKADEEYELYKKAKENPDSIDPMTENSTDWEELDKKYSARYDKENNPMDKIANDRIKEKENTLNNDKILLEGMKKRGLEEINGTTQKDLENRIAKNEEYLKTANSNQNKSFDWKNQIEVNNRRMEKDVTDLQNKINEYRTKSANAKDGFERYQYLKEAEKLQDQYYERFRENERANAKIKVEEPNEKYMNVEAYAGYKDKFNETWGKDGSNDKVVSAKMYTNDEFMEHLEDANWHGERKQLLEAGLTNKELSYIKDKTKVSAWGVENLTGKEQVEKVIQEARNQNTGNTSNSISLETYEKYKKEHPNTKLTFGGFKKMIKK